MSTPTIIDIEASGFGHGSYPIEIGLVHEDGSAYCTLIQPEEDWVHWDDRAEAIHGLSRDTLYEHGQPVAQVAAQLNDLLKGKTVYSDAWGNDSSWLGLLYYCSAQTCQFKIETIRKLLNEQQLACWHHVKADVMEDLSLKRHRASADARILQLTFQRSLARGVGKAVF